MGGCLRFAHLGSFREEGDSGELDTEPDATRTWRSFLSVESLEIKPWWDWRSLLNVIPFGKPWILQWVASRTNGLRHASLRAKADGP